MRRSFKLHVGLNGVYNGDSEFMAGESIMFSGPADKIPAGYLIEDGAEVGRVAYATLFAAIGTINGAGDGATTFNLPDSRGEFWRGLDLGRGRDVGRMLGSVQGDEMRSHTHVVHDPGHSHQYPTGGVGGGGYPAMTNGHGSWDNTIHVATGVWLHNTGGAENRPSNIAKIPLIKY